VVLFWCVDFHQQDVVAGEFEWFVFLELDGLSGPEVFGGLRAVQAEFGQAQMEGMGGVEVAAGVEDGDGDGSVFELAGPDFHFALAVDAAGLVAERVLVDGDDAGIGEDGLDLRLHVGQVVAGEQGRGEHGPHGEVGAVFSEAELAVADFKHVGVVPVAGAGVAGEAGLLLEQVVDAVPVGLDVAGGAPEVAAEGGRPLPDRIPPVLAEGKDDGAAGGFERLGHLVIGCDHEAHLRGAVVGGLFFHHGRDEAAEVVLEVVDTPGGIEIGVLLLMAERGLVTAAGLGAGGGVNADFEALGVDVVGEGLHVRELGVGVQDAAGVALALPGVVDVDVDVAGVFHAGGDDLVGGVADVFVSDAFREVIPTVPSHGGRQRHLRWGRRRGWRQGDRFGCEGERGEGKNGEGERSRDTHGGSSWKRFQRESYRCDGGFRNSTVCGSGLVR